MRIKSEAIPRGQCSAASGWRLAAASWLALLFCLVTQPVTADTEQRPTIPDISYPDLEGTLHNLRQWQGHILLLNFWASWCAPCLSEIRHLNGYQTKYGESGLQVVGVGLDDPVKLKNVQRTLAMNYPVLTVDEKQSRSVLSAWGNKTGMIPFTVIFDSSGRVVRAHRGVIDERLFNRLVKPLLQATTD
jgi:peroxiredoxin